MGLALAFALRQSVAPLLYLARLIATLSVRHRFRAWASYNTSGLVVPVFSNNIHEVRSYNRLARIARGDVLILV